MGLRVGEWERGREEKREWRKKEDMTTPVKDISCHETLLLLSLPAPFLQFCSALLIDHGLSFNLFSLPPLHLLPLSFSLSSSYKSSLNPFLLTGLMSSQMPWVMPLFPFAALQFFGLCRTAPSLALTVVRVSQAAATFVPFIRGQRIPLNRKPRIRCCCSLLYTWPVHQRHSSKPLALWRVHVHKYKISFQLSLLFGWNPE